MILSTVEMHTGGEPTRIIVDGWPAFSGRTLLDKRREAKERFDHLRRGLMLEPRGHDGMYGALLVEPDHPEADLAVLFMHNEGYSTMCGHATIALVRWAVESGRVTRSMPETIVRLQCPCGLVVARVAADGTVHFESVPAFAYARDRIAPTATWGPVAVDIAYGGAFYAILPADSIGLDLKTSPMRSIVDAGEERLFESCTGAQFSGRLLRDAPAVGPRKASIVEVGGRAYVTGESRFRFDADDPLREGFSLTG
ncbi:MAG: hypothetical protein BGN99_08965 [Alphaproteobacteria bacterium 65-37]|nr:MAG: hypothetical protein BGN99_08965 [Alphaproteobacteria bacterium 65-37]